MTKVTNFIATVTDVNSEFPAKGAAVPNSNRCVIKDQTGETAGSVGAADNWYIDESASPFVTYTNPRLPRWQDLVQTTTTTTTTICVPLVYDTPGGFGISGPTTAVVGTFSSGPFYTYTFYCSSTIPADYPFTMSIQQAGPVIVNYPGSVGTTNLITWNGPGVLAPGYYDTRQVYMQAVPGYWRIGVINRCTDTLGNPDYFYINPEATTTTTSTTSTTTSTSTTSTTTTLCPTCTYGVSVGTTTSCSGGTATQNISINSSCGNSEARLVAVGNGAVTTGWLNVNFGVAIYSFTSVSIGTYNVEIRPKSAVTTCPSQITPESFNVCCNTSATWTNTGSQYCDGCAIKQLQTDTNFCSSTYNTTRVITISASDASCGTWGPQTQYCPNYGVYPFQLRTRETNTCGQTRNDSLVANLSPTCGYSCGYWGLSVIFNGYFCNNTTNGSGVVTISVGVANGSYEARLVSTGAGVTTGWLAGNTFTGVYDGTYYAEVRSTSDNSCTASTVGTGQNYQTVACCSTTPNWVDNGAAYCDNCVSKQPQIDNNPCSSTYNQTRVINAGSACNTTQNWVNTGSYNCYSTCNKYNVEIQNNPCASGYNTTRQGSVAEYGSTFCGGCCGQSTAANWVNSGSYNCYGSCTKYNVEVDNNGCSPTYGQTQQGSLVESNSSFCGGCCGSSPSANWVNNGATFCMGCYLNQPQIDDNPCSSTYGDTRDVDLGVNTACGAWVQSFYCVGYDKWSKETNTCTGNIRDQYLVEVNSAYCGYVPPPTCRTYQIIGYNSDEYVDGVYTNCAGFPDSFSFFGGPGTVGYVCAQPSTVYITSGNGAANDVGSC
jgi:hypothetical protein